MVHATYTAGYGDSLTYTALNEQAPVGPQFNAIYNGNYASRYDYTFSTSTPGSYVFTPLRTDERVPVVGLIRPIGSLSLSLPLLLLLPAWCHFPRPPSPKASPPPSHTLLRMRPASRSTMSVPLTPDTSGSTSVSPSQSTDYTGTVSSGGVTNYCTASGTTPPGKLTVSCNPTYSCSGNTIQYTNASCAVSNVTSCVSLPRSAPQAPPHVSTRPSVSITTSNPPSSFTGGLQLVPNIVHPGNSMQVYWNVSNAQSCTVRGSNGDSWTGLSSPLTGATSSPITSQTTYTLTCLAYGSNPNVSQTQLVNVTPLYQEK